MGKGWTVREMLGGRTWRESTRVLTTQADSGKL